MEAVSPQVRNRQVGQLTGRELEVLAMLATGIPNQAIAEETVRHLVHTSATSWVKLGAANRIETVARAREFGLIP